MPSPTHRPEASPGALPDRSNPALVEAIAQQVRQRPDQRLTFSEFMHQALYHPQHGYYASNQARIGAGGDFFTSPHLGADFGELLAEQFAEMWRLMDCPQPFTLLEMGAGQGVLVQDVLRYLHRHHPTCFASLDYIILETSGAMVAEQKQRLQTLADDWGHLHWRNWDEIPSDSLVGCCFSNELVDAFPVHQVVWQDNTLREVYVTLAESGDQPFTEVIAELSTPTLVDYFGLVGIRWNTPPYPDGYRTEVNLAALDWLATVGDRLQRGFLVTIDYGYAASRYYAPSRTQGTLQCYFQHAHHHNPYIHLGQQDITAHADFTALEQQGERCGLHTVGFTQQGLFLMALGLGDRIAALSEPEIIDTLSPMEILRRRESLHSLANPMGLGNFGVLVQSKAMPEVTLRGLTVPEFNVSSTTVLN
jgi:SAM-dependent MidA family methyltransferase